MRTRAHACDARFMRVCAQSHGEDALHKKLVVARGPSTLCAIQKGTRVRISLWDSLMFRRVPGYPPEH